MVLIIEAWDQSLKQAGRYHKLESLPMFAVAQLRKQ